MARHLFLRFSIVSLASTVVMAFCLIVFYNLSPSASFSSLSSLASGRFRAEGGILRLQDASADRTLSSDCGRTGRVGGDDNDNDKAPRRPPNRLAPEYDSNIASRVAELARRRAASRDTELVSLARDLMDPPPTNDAPYKMFQLYKTPQSTEVDTLLNRTEGGFFVECGALTGELLSNTAWLERQRRWQGLLIEMDPFFYTQLLGKNRRVWSINACLSPYNYFTTLAYHGDKGSRGYLIVNRHVAGADAYDAVPVVTETPRNKRKPPPTVPCFPLETLLAAVNRSRVDYFSLDIEGFELPVLKSVNWSRVDISVLSVEFLHGKEVYNDTLHNWVSLDQSCRWKVRPIMFVENLTSPCSGSVTLMTSARNLGWSMLELPRTSISGLPFLKDMHFETARRFPDCTFYGFANGDIVFNGGLVKTLQAVSMKLDILGRTMITGRRTNVQWLSNETMQLPDNVTLAAKKRGRLFLLEAEDYFFIAMNAFPWHRVPSDLVIARPGYDNFFVATAIMNNVSVVDATNTLLAVHMTDREGNLAGSKNRDMLFNKRLIGRFKYHRGMTSSAQYATLVARNNTDNTEYIFLRRRVRKPSQSLNVSMRFVYQKVRKPLTTSKKRASSRS